MFTLISLPIILAALLIVVLTLWLVVLLGAVAIIVMSLCGAPIGCYIVIKAWWQARKEFRQNNLETAKLGIVPHEDWDAMLRQIREERGDD